VKKLGTAGAWAALRWRQSLVVSLTLMAFAAVALLAVVVSRVVGNQIETDALARAGATAEVLARSSFAPALPSHGRTLTRAAVRALDAQVAAARASQPGTEVLLRDRGGRILYSSAGAAQAAAAVQTGTLIVGRGGERRVRSTLPVRARRAGAPDAYLQLEVPYAPVAHDISVRTRRLDVVLGLTALAIYLLALPSLLRAGRALRLQYDPRRMQLARDVKRAIKKHELSMAYQPIVDSKTRELRSVEALVRWSDPRRGVISPGSFIPALEQTGAMWDLTCHVFDLSFAQCAQWRREGLDIHIAVNVSGAVLLDKRLLGALERLADRHHVPADMLEIEITEGALVQDPREATRMLTAIAAIGLRVIAIDDFGTGYSSLARLHELPLDTLKIDQSFVHRMAAGGDTAIVRSVVDLAHALGLDVIAEGVEDEQTAELLGELGCEYLQGYQLGRPLPAHDLVRWLGRAGAVGMLR
jgi:EAL domain-containing protein (putative c-di-GMP-specific phosphodiesterase class I)